MTKAQANDKYMVKMRNKGIETIFRGELPYPANARNCTQILGRRGNIIYIKEEA